MRLWIKSISSRRCIVTLCCRRIKRNEGSKMTQAQKIDALFQLWRQDLCPGGQILVRQKGKVLYENCFGYANLEHQIPITPETVFHVASVSKQVTALAILLLQEDGKLNIDDDVRHYLPELIQFAEPVSLRQMMNMVSGIRDQWLALIYHGVRIDDTITMRDTCLLYTSDAADDLLCVDLGG